LIHLLPSTSLLSLLSWFSFSVEAVLIFVTPTMGAGKEAYHPLSPHVKYPKCPLVITLLGSGLLHKSGLPNRLQIGHLLTTHMSRIPNTLNLTLSMEAMAVGAPLLDFL
jgi:hypothetical protein